MKARFVPIAAAFLLAFSVSASPQSVEAAGTLKNIPFTLTAAQNPCRPSSGWCSLSLYANILSVNATYTAYFEYVPNSSFAATEGAQCHADGTVGYCDYYPYTTNGSLPWVEGLMSGYACVRGHEKVPTGGHVEVPTLG